MMGNRKKLRILVGILKDVSSIIKATLSTKPNSKIVIAVVRATAHNVSDPSSDKRIIAFLSLGDSSRQTACRCVEALMDRLHGTNNASVALKCLLAIHTIIFKGSFILKDQLSFHPSNGGRNFLNLSKFRDDSDPETWELSSWVRWYAAVIEQNLMVSRILGHYRSSSISAANIKDKEEKALALLSRDLQGQIDVLVDFVQLICEAPESLHLQSNSLVYEVVRLVCEDYRFIQREIFLRVAEFRDRMTSLSSTELTQLLGTLKRYEDCKERLFSVFVSRSRNDGLWELIRETKMKTSRLIKEKEGMKMVVEIKRIEDSSELTRSRERLAQLGNLGECLYKNMNSVAY